MKISKINILALSILVLAAATSCKKLSLQKDYDRTPRTVDPELHKSAGKFLTDRATGVAATNDTIFAWMLRGINYAGIDLAEYEKSGKTFVLLHNDAIRRVTKVSGKDSTQPDCFFGANMVNGKVAQKWEDYPQDFVRNSLLYLIANSVQDHYTMKLPDENYDVATMAAEGFLNTLPPGITRNPQSTGLGFIPNNNPKSLLRFRVTNSSPSNTSDYPIVLNDSRNVRTSSMLATNGSVHVIDRFLATTLIPN